MIKYWIIYYNNKNIFVNIDDWIIAFNDKALRNINKWLINYINKLR